MSTQNADLITNRVLAWGSSYGRNNLPWQGTQDKYVIWISEIMLQQTQVATVLPYFERFMAQFPTVDALAAAPLDSVLAQWAGLGYYARARNLHKAATIIATHYQGLFPSHFDDVLKLPGIGRSTAGAILAFSENKPFAILDGNVKRVLCRYYGIEGWPGRTAVSNTLWELSEKNTSSRHAAAYTQAIMDIGATVCHRSNPNCNLCPLHDRCRALAQDRLAELPQRKPSRNNPIKTSQCAVIHNNKGEVLLERRPLQGIWGGLWCPPESDILIAQALKKGAILPPIKHHLSHFQLHLTPIIVAVEDIEFQTVADAGKQIWYKLQNPQDIGLAAPIKVLLNHLAKTQLK